MFSAFFGNYLLEKKVVTAKQLSTIMSKQEKTRLRLGMLAVNAKYMTAGQADEVNELQATMDKRFGDIAIEKAYLTTEQLESLLGQQKSEHLILAQNLIDAKIMTMKQFEKEIETYKVQFGLDDDQFEGLKANDVDLLVHAFVAFDDGQGVDYYSDYVSLFIKNIIRFIDGNIRFDRVQKVEHESFEHVVRQSISGENDLFTGIGLDEKAFLALAGKYANESFTEMGEYPIDAAGEFLNLHNGLFTVNMSDQGVEMSLDIQSYIEDVTFNPSATLYSVPVYTSIGVINLVFGNLY